MEEFFYKRQILKPMEKAKNHEKHDINFSSHDPKKKLLNLEEDAQIDKEGRIVKTTSGKEKNQKELLKKRELEENHNSKEVIDNKKIEKEIKKAFVKEENRYLNYNKDLERASNLEVNFDEKGKSTTNGNSRKKVTIGFSDKMINCLTDTNYWTDVMRMPKMSFIFHELDFNKEIQSQKKNLLSRKKSPLGEKSKKVVNFSFWKPRKGEMTLTVTARMVIMDGTNRIVSSEEAYKNFNDIYRNPEILQEKNLALLKANQNSFDIIEKKNAIKVVESWKKTSQSISTNKKFFNRTDYELNAKKIASMCSREWKKCFAKQKKSSNDIFVKLRKMAKDIHVFLKRRNKELIEIKKKREKIEMEISKIEEEKREEKKQQRKIEFLIKQSGIYAEFMASKLGLKHTKIENQKPIVNLTKEEQEEAQKNVHKIIENQKEKLQEYEINQTQIKSMNFADVQIDRNSQLIDTPKSFHGSLKNYQIKGLRWLDNLYSQGINGILADEMGLGKTIQALALLAHISERKNNWGPFLVIAPAITLFNWYSEASRFVPAMKILPYWGSQKDRKVVKKYLQQKYLGQKSSNFHLIITSYQLAVSDEKTLQRVKWQYIILDEAQAIKNINSLRWNTLLNLKSRNKLLLTGTPIQNTMAELWALLHFIMPQLFDSHEQFKEWFSKDIEANSQQKNQLNKTQLDRLHAILKPFMLRRVKKDVEKEIGQKFEHNIYCELTERQQILYNKIKSKISIESFFHLKANKDKVKNLMNLVMQFRKVCNHPELFERRIARTSLYFNEHYFYPSHFYFSQKLGMKCVAANFYSNPFNSPYPRLLENFEYDLKSNKFYDFLNFPLLTEFKNMLKISEIEFQTFLFPTSVNLLTFVSNIHYILKRRQTNNVLKLFGQKGISFKIEILKYSITDNIFIEKVLANRPILNRSKKTNSSLFKLWKVSEFNTFKIEFPGQSVLITDSCKMRYLEKLLEKLKSQNQRALIFCQMTKMMDIIEEFLIFKKYQFFRLDGASNISDRRDMVNEYQSNPDIFVFLLSTRAGGLGVTLTAADVVIFYDNDWNPTMDAQAADRAHRIGRTKDINIYKLITKKTIEERIMQRAKQKKDVQQTVYSGEVFKANFFKPHDVVDLVFDNDEIKERKDLRIQRALLHAKKTGKNGVIKEKKNSANVHEQENGGNEILEEGEKNLEITKKEKDKNREIEEEFEDVLKLIGEKMDLSKFL
jgi:DNA helicase INO80